MYKSIGVFLRLAAAAILILPATHLVAAHYAVTGMGILILHLTTTNLLAEFRQWKRPQV